VYYKDGNPINLEEWPADELYKIGNLGPNGYVVAFNRDEAD